MNKSQLKAALLSALKNSEKEFELDDYSVAFQKDTSWPFDTEVEVYAFSSEGGGDTTKIFLKEDGSLESYFGELIPFREIKSHIRVFLNSLTDDPGILDINLLPEWEQEERQFRLREGLIPSTPWWEEV